MKVTIYETSTLHFQPQWQSTALFHTMTSQSISSGLLNSNDTKVWDKQSLSGKQDIMVLEVKMSKLTAIYSCKHQNLAIQVDNLHKSNMLQNHLITKWTHILRRIIGQTLCLQLCLNKKRIHFRMNMYV